MREAGVSRVKRTPAITVETHDDRTVTLGRFGQCGGAAGIWSGAAPLHGPRLPCLVLAPEATRACGPSGRSIGKGLSWVSRLRTPVTRLADAVERLAACVGFRVARPNDRARLCPMRPLTSDPHGWLRPTMSRLKNDGVFWMLAGPGSTLRGKGCLRRPSHCDVIPFLDSESRRVTRSPKRPRRGHGARARASPLRARRPRACRSRGRGG